MHREQSLQVNQIVLYRSEILFEMSDNNKGQHRDVFVWTTMHEKCLIAHLLVVEPYTFKPCSKEKGLAWKKIADNLNSLSEPKFCVTHRSVCDKFNKLLEKFKQNERIKARASGIEGVDFDEVYRGLMDISERMEEAKLILNNTDDKSREKENGGKRKADEIRKIAMERLSEMKKRKEEDGREVTPKRKRKCMEAMALVEQGLKIKEENAKMERAMRQ